MTQDNAIDFSKLYRAAFAERDPQRKLVLLSQVHMAVKPWEEETSFAAAKFEPGIPSPAKVAA